MELGVDRILFSVDYPFVDNPPGTEWMERSRSAPRTGPRSERQRQAPAEAVACSNRRRRPSQVLAYVSVLLCAALLVVGALAAIFETAVIVRTFGGLTAVAALIVGTVISRRLWRDNAPAQLKVLISGGILRPLRACPEFERATGIKLATGSGSSQGSGPQTIKAAPPAMCLPTSSSSRGKASPS